MPERFRIIIRKTQPLDYNDVLTYIQRVAATRDPLHRMTYFNSADEGGRMYFNMDDQGDIFTRIQRLQILADGLENYIKNDQRHLIQLRFYVRDLFDAVDPQQYDEETEENPVDQWFDAEGDDFIRRLNSHPDTKLGIRVGSMLPDPINRVPQYVFLYYVQNSTLAPVIRMNIEAWLRDNQSDYYYESDDSSVNQFFEGSDFSDSEEDISEEDQLIDLLAELPKPAKPIVGEVYTLDEFRVLLPMKKKVVMGTADEVDCGLNTNTAPKTEPVVIEVQRPRGGSGLRLKYECDRSGDTLYVFCADKLREWLRTKVPNYNRLQDTNPFNNKIIYRVKYLTQKEANDQWKIRVKEKEKEEKLLGTIRKDASENPMLQMFVNRIEKTQKELAIYSDNDTLDYAFEDVSMAIDNLKRDLKKLKTGTEVVTSSKLLQDKDIDRREGAKKILDALRDEAIQKEEELERLEARAQFLSLVIKDENAREAEKTRLSERLSNFISQYEGLRNRLTPNTKALNTKALKTKALNTKAPNNNIIQRMAKLKF